MNCRRGLLAVSLCVSFLTKCEAFPAPGSAPLGVLTQAYGAHINAAEAFPGLSIFAGERLATDSEGRMGVRVGDSQIALSGDTVATMNPITRGAHVDLSTGSIYFSATENSRVELHFGEALLRPESKLGAQAEVTVLSPTVLQVVVKRGDLGFTYRDEFQLLPAGQTYRIYLEAPAEPQGLAGAGAGTTKAAGAAQNSAHLHKVAYFIIGGTATGLTAWGIHELVVSGNAPESPAKP